MLHLLNLSSSELVEGLAPWEFDRIDLVPEECFTNKKARDAWINKPTTRYHVYSGIEGTQANLRIHIARANLDENPPLLVRFIPADCDVPTTFEEAIKYVEKMRIKPMWFEQTLSGHGRFIWVFEKPALMVNRTFCKAFLRDIATLLPIKMLPGVDQGAIEAPERYYTNGARWTKLSNDVVPHSLVSGYELKVCEKFNWKQRELGKAANLAHVAEECKKRYPRFAEWPGEFTVGSPGPSFWIDGSVSPKSAIVHETGCYTFAEHRIKPFYSWAEIVGARFVEESENKTLGDAVKEVYYDGQRFFYLSDGQKWFDCGRDDVKLQFRAKGLSGKGQGNEMSPIDRALNYVITKNRVDSASSWPFYPKGVFNYYGRMILNTHQRDVIQPAQELTPWGITGKFPTLSFFIDNAFTSEVQPHYLLYRLKRAYVGCLNRKPKQGQGLVLCGPPGVGKGFLIRGIMGYVLGGFADAGAYLSGKDNFNSELFDFALWTMDDGTGLTSESVHRMLSERSKQTVANPEHRNNEKFRKASMSAWEHLLCLSYNDDPESTRGIVSLDMTTRDKFIALRMNSQSPFQFQEKDEMTLIIEREAPYFLRWLMDYKPPGYVTENADTRYGMNSFCEPSLLRITNQSSPVNSFFELLMKWLREYFETEQPQATEWRGNATDLRVAMSRDLIFAELLRGYKQDAFSRHLAQIQSKNLLKLSISDSENERIWIIERDDRFTKAKPGLTPPQSDKYQKP